MLALRACLCGGRRRAQAQPVPGRSAGSARPRLLRPAAPAQPAPAAQAGRGAAGRLPGGRPVPGRHHLRRNVCTPVEPPIHALLFRKEGGATAFIPFYFHRRGNPGYRVIAPFYWHFWSPEGKTEHRRPVLLALRGLPGPAGGHGHPALLAHRPARRRVLGDLAALLPLDQVRLGGAAAAVVQDREPRRAAVVWAFTPCCTSGSATAQAGTRLRPVLPVRGLQPVDRAHFTWFLPLNFYWRNGAGDKAHSNLLLLPLPVPEQEPGGRHHHLAAGVRPLAGPEQQRGPSPGCTGTGGGRTAAATTCCCRSSTEPPAHRQHPRLAARLLLARRREQARRRRLAVLVRATASRRRSTQVVRRRLFPLRLELPVARSPTPRCCRCSCTCGGPPTASPRCSRCTGRPGTRKRARGWKLLLPLYFSRTGEEGQTFTWLTPLGGYRRDSVHDTRTLPAAAAVSPPARSPARARLRAAVLPGATATRRTAPPPRCC